MTSDGFQYLASAYSNPSRRVMHERYLAVLDAKAWCLKRRVWVYSPIVHCHETARLHDLPTDSVFWKEYNHAMIRSSTGLLILDGHGVSLSVGVREEFEFASQCGLLVNLIVRQRDGIYAIEPPSAEWLSWAFNGGERS